MPLALSVMKVMKDVATIKKSSLDGCDIKERSWTHLITICCDIMSHFVSISILDV